VIPYEYVCHVLQRLFLRCEEFKLVYNHGRVEWQPWRSQYVPNQQIVALFSFCAVAALVFAPSCKRARAVKAGTKASTWRGCYTHPFHTPCMMALFTSIAARVKKCCSLNGLCVSVFWVRIIPRQTWQYRICGLDSNLGFWTDSWCATETSCVVAESPHNH